MKNLFKTAAWFTTGMIAGIVMIDLHVNKGEVVYNDDDMYIRVEKAVGGGASWAKVFYKNPK
jgi:hypothetical protein